VSGNGDAVTWPDVALAGLFFLLVFGVVWLIVRN